MPQVSGLGGQLHSLDLSGCSLQGQQGHLLESLPGLNAVVLANNCITDWPFCSSKGSALQLRELDLSHNPLKCIPVDGLDFCSKSLTRLNLRGESIAYLAFWNPVMAALVMLPGVAF